MFTQLTDHDASAVGLVMALQFGPQLLLLPWTGVAADHFNQRKLLIATQATMGSLALILGLLTVTGAVELWHVYIFALERKNSGCRPGGSRALQLTSFGRARLSEIFQIEINDDGVPTVGHCDPRRLTAAG